MYTNKRIIMILILNKLVFKYNYIRNMYGQKSGIKLSTRLIPILCIISTINTI